MLAHILAGALLDEDVDQRHDGADGPAEECTAEDPGRGVEDVSGQVAIEGRHQRNVLEGIDDVDEVGEAEAVLAEE